MKRIAALYARVSTRRQEEEETIDSQIAAIEDYARKQGFALLKELYFIDEAVSGAKLDRPGLDRLRDQASEGHYQLVVCLCPDRLARRYALQVLLLEEFKRAGIEVVFTNQTLGSDDPQSDLLRNIQGLFAEYERTQIGERMRRGRLHRVRQGHPINSLTPYGFQYIPKSQDNGQRWEIDPEEAAIVRKIYAWYTQLEPLSMREIAVRLQTGADVYPPRFGKQWAASTVGNILRQDQYTGQAYYNRTQGHDEEIGQLRQVGHGRLRYPSRTSRLQEEWVTIPVPALIDKEIWLSAQERLKMNQKYAKRNNQHNFYLLRGLLVCAICGHSLYGRTARGNVSYACGTGKSRRPPDVPEHSCTIAESVIEPLIWQSIVELLQNPQLIARAWEASGEKPSPQDEPGEKDRLEGRVRTLDRQRERLLDLFLEEQLDKPTYQQRTQRLQEEKLALQQRLTHYAQQERLELSKQSMMLNFEQYCQRVLANLTDPSLQQKQEIIRLLVDHVVVGQGEIVIKHIIPADDDCRLRPLCSEPGIYPLASRCGARRRG
jgi:site-specific DNA recombinase